MLHLGDNRFTVSNLVIPRYVSRAVKQIFVMIK